MVEPDVAAVITWSAVRAERVISAVRLAFITLVFGHTLFATSLGDGTDTFRVWLTLANYVAIAAFSIYALVRLRPSPRLGSFLVSSVVVDAIGCFQALSVDVLFPWEGYPGLIRTPDVAALIVIIFAAGVRLSVAAAVVGGLLNMASFAVLAALDQAISGAHALVAYSIFAVYLLGAAALAVILAMRTRDLVARGGRAALQAEQTRQSMAALLHDQHDVRTQLAAATLHADLLLQGLSGGSPQTLARELRHDLDRANALIEEIKVRASGQLATLEPAVPVEVSSTLDEALALVRERFPAVELTSSNEAGSCRVLARGGPKSLRGFLLKLLVNACEGDGRRRSSRVEVRIARAVSPDRVRIEVADDGPGFPEHVLHATASAAVSTKAHGWGLGLRLVDKLVRANGGTFTRGNRTEGGALVSIELPLAG